MDNDYLELYHHGTKGMKWGVRKYQDENGNLTELGKERYGVKSKNYAEARVQADVKAKALAKVNGYKIKGTEDEKTGKKNKGTYTTQLTNKFTQEEIDRRIARDASNEYREHIDTVNKNANSVMNIGKESGNLLNNTAKILPTGNGTVIKKDYSDLTDEELRKRINRLSMEDQYGKLTGDTKYVKSGSEKTREIFQTTAGAIAVAGSAAAIAIQIANLVADHRSSKIKNGKM